MDQEAAGLKEIERRQLKYWSVDGLPELVASLGCLLWGGLYLMGTTMFLGRSYLAYSSAVWFTLFLWGFGVQWAIEKLKEEADGGDDVEMLIRFIEDSERGVIK